MKTNKQNKFNYDSAALADAVKTGKTIYAVFTGRKIAYYQTWKKTNRLECVASYVSAKRPWMGSSVFQDAKYTVALLIKGAALLEDGHSSKGWQGLNIQTLNFY